MFFLEVLFGPLTIHFFQISGTRWEVQLHFYIFSSVETPFAGMRSSHLFVLEKNTCPDGTLEERGQKMLLFENQPATVLEAGRKVKFDDFSSTVACLTGTDCNERIRKRSRGENYSVSNAGESNSNNTLALAP